MAGTIIKQCTCAHEYQDKIYGKKMRLCNLKEGGKNGKCTVCGNKI